MHLLSQLCVVRAAAARLRTTIANDAQFLSDVAYLGSVWRVGNVLKRAPGRPARVVPVLVFSGQDCLPHSVPDGVLSLPAGLLPTQLPYADVRLPFVYLCCTTSSTLFVNTATTLILCSQPLVAVLMCPGQIVPTADGRVKVMHATLSSPQTLSVKLRRKGSSGGVYEYICPPLILQSFEDPVVNEQHIAAVIVKNTVAARRIVDAIVNQVRRLVCFPI